MFSQELQTIKYFTDDFARSKQQLERIRIVSTYGLDNVAGAVARALLFNRLPEGQTFSIYSVGDGSDKYLKLIGNPDEMKNTFIIVNCDDPESRSIEGFTDKPEHAKYFKSWMNCKTLINDEIHSAVIFIESADMRKIHLAVSLFPAYYPSIFKDNKLTDLEKQLCMSLIVRSDTKFLETMEQLGKVYGFEAEYTAYLLRTYQKTNAQAIIDRADRERMEAQHSLDRNIDEYRVLYKELQEKILRYETLCTHQPEDDNELADYFSHHRNLKLISVDGDTLRIEVQGKLDWFDVDFYERAASHDEIYDFDRGSYSREDVKRFMDALFSNDPKFTVRMCAYFELSVSSASVMVYSGHEFTPATIEKYVPNPHLQRHACLGSYREPIRRCLRSNNMIGAIEQCVASAGSVNLAETNATFKPFMSSLLRNTEKVIVDNEGNEYTVAEAISKLKESV